MWGRSARLLGIAGLTVVILTALVIWRFSSTSHHPTPSWTAPTSSTSRPSGGRQSPTTCKDIARKDIPRGDRDYAPWLDGDLDGVACESDKPD